MENGIYPVSNMLLAELREIWMKSKNPAWKAVRHLCQKFSAKQSGMEEIVLFGELIGGTEFEECDGGQELIIGHLIAVVPGIVLFDASCIQGFRSFSGMVERAPIGNCEFFFVSPFLRRFYPDLKIHAGDCIYGEVGVKRRIYFELGIDRGRWSGYLADWLDRWLPKLETGQ